MGRITRAYWQASAANFQLLEALVDVTKDDEFIEIRFLVVGVGLLEDWAEPQNGVPESAAIGALEHGLHVIGVAGIVGEQLLRVEHVCFVVGGGAFEFHGFDEADGFPAAGFALEGDVAECLVGGDFVGIELEPLEIHLDGVFVIAGAGYGLASIEEDFAFGAIFRRNLFILSHLTFPSNPPEGDRNQSLCRDERCYFRAANLSEAG